MKYINLLWINILFLAQPYQICSVTPKKRKQARTKYVMRSGEIDRYHRIGAAFGSVTQKKLDSLGVTQKVLNSAANFTWYNFVRPELTFTTSKSRVHVTNAAVVIKALKKSS